MKQVIVPQCDINAVENARIQLHSLLRNIEDGEVDVKYVSMLALNITRAFYVLSHSRYKEAFWSKIKRSIFGIKDEVIK